MAFIANRRAARLARATQPPKPVIPGRPRPTAITRRPETLQGVPGSTPLPQPERVALQQARIASTSGPRVYNLASDVEKQYKADLVKRTASTQTYEQKKQALDTSLSQGTINQDQYVASLTEAEKERMGIETPLMTEAQMKSAVDRLNQGFTGVNPLGFGQDQYGNPLPQIGGTLRAPGETPAALAARREVGPLQSPEAGAMGRPGAVGFNPQGFEAAEPGGFGSPITQPKLSFGGDLARRMQNLSIPLTAGDLTQAGVAADPATVAQINADRARQLTELQQQSALQQKETREQEQRQMFEGAAQDTATQQVNAQFSLQEAGLLSQLQKYSPDMVPAIQDWLSQQRDLVSQNQELYGTGMAKIQKTFSDIEDRMDTIRSDANRSFDIAQGFAEQEKKNNESIIESERTAQEARAKLDQDKDLAEGAKTKERNHQNMVVQLALAGGFGQDAGLDAVRSADNYYDQQMADLRETFRVEGLERSSRFTSAYLENSNNYLRASKENVKNLADALERVEIQGMSNDVSKLNAQQSLLDKHWGIEVDLKREKSKTVLDISRDIEKMVSDERIAKYKASKEGSMSTKDKLSFLKELRSGINQNKTIMQANDVDGFYGAGIASFNEYERLYDQWKNGELGNISEGEFMSQYAIGPAQTGVIGSLARMLDPGSVVRNEEYERQTRGQSLINQARGLWDKWQAGGTGLTNTDILAMKSLADEIHGAWEERLNQNLQGYILDVNDWNDAYPDQMIPYSQVLPVDRMHLPEMTIERWSRDAMGEEDDTFSSGEAPEGGFRTDRHNNPTAFTVDIAKQAGLREGVDYESGDPFSHGVTARILGDPIATTIRVIDKIGFYTRGGGQRWTHTAMSRNDWNSLPYSEKSAVIAQMYKKEGGSGELFGGIRIASNQSPSPVASPKTTILTQEGRMSVEELQRKDAERERERQKQERLQFGSPIVPEDRLTFPVITS